MSENPSDYMDLADEALDDLGKMIESEVSVRPLYSRLYYAVFYSAKAGLLSRGVEAKTHRGTASQAYQILFDEKDLISKEEAMVLQSLQEKRDMADYELEINFDMKDFNEDYSRSENFIRRMKEIIEKE